MSNKVINFIISARDQASSVFRRAFAGIKSSLLGLGRAIFSLPSLIAGSAIVGALSKVVGASMEADRATRKLAGALALSGDASEKTLRDFTEFATELQKVTVFEDDATAAAMALGLNLGVPRDRLKEVTKAAMGLSAATGMDLQTAMMLFGRTAAGATVMLSRYGIVLEEGLSQQDRMNRLLEIGAEKFALATASAKGTSGAWAQLKVAIGNLWEKFGEAVDRTFDLEGVFQRLKGWIDEIDGEKIARSFSSAVNVVRSLFNGSVDWLNVLKNAGVVVGLSLKVGFLEATNFLIKALKGVVTGLAGSLPQIGILLWETMKFVWSPSTWANMAKIIIGSMAGLGSYLLQIFTAPISALGAGLDKVWLEFSNAMASTKVGQWAGFETKEDKTYGELYDQRKKDMADFLGESRSGSKDLIREGVKGMQAPLENLGRRGAEFGRKFADGVASEMDEAGVFDTSKDAARIGGILQSARDGLRDLAKPTLLGDVTARAAKDAAAITPAKPRAKLAEEAKKESPIEKRGGELKVASSTIDLAEAFDISRGQGSDQIGKIAENTARTNRLLERIASSEGVK